MLTEQQIGQLDAIYAADGRYVKMFAKGAYFIANAEHQRISQEMYTSHEQAANALINGKWTPAAQRVETCVQHGSKNKVQWARKTQAKVNVMNGGSL